MAATASQPEAPASAREREFAWALEHPWRVVWALTAFALVLRFATLDARGFWLDEAITVDLIRGSLGDVTSRLDAYTLDQPPLYYLLAWGWAQVFGTGEVGLRSLPAICGALAVPVAYLAATELFSKRAGLVAALLTALSPLVVWHSQDARPYALLILLGGASFALFVRVLHDRRPWVVAGWAVASVLAMATHYAVGFLIAAEVIWLLCSIRRRTAVVTVLAGVAAVGVGVLLLQARRSSGGALGDGLWTQSYTEQERLLQVPAQLLVGYQPPLQLVSAGVAALLAGAALALLVAKGGRREHSAAAIAAFVCVIGVGVPMLLAAKGDLSGLTTRYLVGAWVPLVAIAAAGLTTRGSGRVGVAVATALCALFLAVVLGSAWEPKFDRDDWRGAAQALGPAAVARAVVVSPGLGTPALELYLPGSRALRERGEPVREVALVGLPEVLPGARASSPGRPASYPARRCRAS